MRDTTEDWKRLAIDEIAKYGNLQEEYIALQEKHIKVLQEYQVTLVELRDALKRINELEDQLIKSFASKL